MGWAQRLRTGGAAAIVAVGVPTLVIGNMSHGQAGNLTGATLGSPTSTLGGTTAKAATNSTGTTSGTTSSSATGAGTNLPADKMTVAASKVDVIGPGADVTLLSAPMRTSNPADLTFSVTLECSILTSVTTVGNDTQSAMGDVKVWVEIDGQNVGVLPAQPGQSDDGKVTFCNRTFTATTSNFTADPNATIQDYIKTKDANAFNWVAMNVGAQIHTISIHATLTQTTTNSTKDMAEAVVGNRTVVVNVTQTAQNQAQ